MNLCPYPSRHRECLDGLWNFRPVADEESTPQEGRGEEVLLAVPGVWESSFQFFEHRGRGLYQREFRIPDDGDYCLLFECVSHTAEVRLDGHFLGRHYGAHTPFELRCGRLDTGMHRLEVLVDNGFGPGNPLTRARSDIYTYGGIVRSVWLERIPETAYFTSVRILPKKAEDTWVLHVNYATEMRNFRSLEVRVLLAGREAGRFMVSGQAESLSVQAGRPETWSTSNPCLHCVEVMLVDLASDIVLDTFRLDVGFRTIECAGPDLLLNGERIVLCGINRHEFHPDFGPALPPTVQLRDLEILGQLGVNFVRVSHYPSDPLFLALCDRAGILVWEELGHWQPTATDLASEAFLTASLVELEEMVLRDLHHPCVIIWGMLNEGRTDLEISRSVVRTLGEKFREIDGTRLVSFASNQKDDICFDLVDVVSRNLYPGWYEGRLSDAAALVRDAVTAIAGKAKGKPVILSEFGAAAGWGVRSFEMRKWTENYQAALLSEVIGAAAEQGVAGVCAWQYCDVRTSAEHGLDRYREYNNKGVVNEYRQPKLGFETLGQALREFQEKSGCLAGSGDSQGEGGRRSRNLPAETDSRQEIEAAKIKR